MKAEGVRGLGVEGRNGWMMTHLFAHDSASFKIKSIDGCQLGAKKRKEKEKEKEKRKEK